MQPAKMVPEKFKMTASLVLIPAFLCYSAYLYINLPGKTTPPSMAVARGKMVWQRYNCNACHQVYGLGGYLGPDLTNEYSKRGKEFIHAFLVTGTTVMPDFKLTKDEIDDLLAYLANIDSSGKADPKNFVLHQDGTIEQKD